MVRLSERTDSRRQTGTAIPCIKGAEFEPAYKVTISPERMG